MQFHPWVYEIKTYSHRSAEYRKGGVNSNNSFGGRKPEAIQLSIQERIYMYRKLLSYHQAFSLLFQEERNTFLSILLRLSVNPWLNSRKRNVWLEISRRLTDLAIRTSLVQTSLLFPPSTRLEWR